MIHLTLPWPDKELSPNARVGFRRKAAAVSVARMAGKVAALEAGAQMVRLKPDAPLQLWATFDPPDARRRDMDNMLSSAKGLIDGVFDALGANDCQIQRVTLDRGDIHPGGRVELRIELMETP